MATCVVSGTLKDLSETAISGATVKASAVGPFLSGSTLIANKEISTTTASDGTWSLTLTRTATLSTPRTLQVTFEYTDGVSGKKREEYTISVPDAATANFSDLVTIP